MKNTPSLIPGGLLHTMWLIVTESGKFALKQLSSKIDLNNRNIVENYNESEKISTFFNTNAISTITAIKKNNKYLTILNGKGFLLYPWVDAKSLSEKSITYELTLKMLSILTKIHLLNFDLPKNHDQLIEIYDSKKSNQFISKAEQCELSFSLLLKEHNALLILYHRKYVNALKRLKKRSIISHRDLDQKNVLWDKDKNPFIIDWESAGKINPTHDLLQFALNWSGITHKFDEALFFHVIESYINEGGHILKEELDPAFDAIYSMLDWLFYNCERSYRNENDKEKALGVAQVHESFTLFFQLNALYPSFKRKNEKNSLSVSEPVHFSVLTFLFY